MAVSIDPGEEDVLIRLHKQLSLQEVNGNLLTVIAPKDSERCMEYSKKIRKAGLSVELRSEKPLSCKRREIGGVKGERRHQLRPIARTLPPTDTHFLLFNFQPCVTSKETSMVVSRIYV